MTAFNLGRQEQIQDWTPGPTNGRRFCFSGSLSANNSRKLAGELGVKTCARTVRQVILLRLSSAQFHHPWHANFLNTLITKIY
jgi:hypothetical protein